MQKLILLLLLIPALVTAQKVEYFPKRVNSWDTKTLRPTAFLIAWPDNNAPKPWKLMIAIHGVGERGAGTLDNLQNLYLGPDYNGDGVREGAAFVTDDMKRAINQFGIVLVVPTYETSEFFEPAKINELYDYVQANYTLSPKMLLTGFSYGGGAVFKYISSSTANANRVAYAVPCAGVSSLVDASIPGKAGIPVHAFSNDNDPTVNVSNTKSQVNSINASNPALKALYTVFRRDGHGGNIEAWSLTPPKAPGGQGFTDAAENIYQVFDDIIKTGKPRQMKAGTVIPPPDPDPIPTPTVQAIAKFKLIGANLTLDGSGSTGWANGGDGVWEYVSGPVKYSWDVFTNGSSYIVANTTLKVPGKYVFAFKLKGDPNVQTVTVDFGKIAVSFDSETDLITYSDGTTEKATAVFSAGKWVVKTAAGKIISF
jgi:dienelactone hydrolase